MKKLSIICLIAVLSLAVMGFGYAMWKDDVAINVTAQTGGFSMAFVNNSFMQKDVGSDWTCDDLMLNLRQAPEGKNVGWTTGSFSSSSNDGVLDTMTVTVNNAYPCYYNEISAQVEVLGSIPVKIQYAKLNWMGNEVTLEDGVKYFFFKNGSVIKYNQTLHTSLPLANAVMEFCWMNNAGVQAHPPRTLEESFHFHVIQPADQNTTYTFSIKVEGIQWNESPI